MSKSKNGVKQGRYREVADLLDRIGLNNYQIEQTRSSHVCVTLRNDKDDKRKVYLPSTTTAYGAGPKNAIRYIKNAARELGLLGGNTARTTET